jgi:hypothetical protein
MHNAANQGRICPLDLSFTENVHLFRRAQPQAGAFPPGKSRKRKRWFAQLLQRASELKCVQSRQRRTQEWSNEEAQRLQVTNVDKDFIKPLT